MSNATSQAIDFETASPAEIRRFLRPAPQQRAVTRRSSDGADLGEVALEASIFGIEPNLAVLHQVVTAQLAAARSGTQSTKTRAEVRGGGAKPFRQKGTGRARQGSTRSPQWVGGGVALGPKPRSYAQKTPKKMMVKATPESVATCFVKRLIRHKANRVTVIRPRPRGTSKLPTFRFKGTRNSRLPGCL